MQTALYLIFFESRFFKNGRIWKEGDRSPCLLRISDDRKQSLYQLLSWLTLLVSVVIDMSVSLYLHIHE